MYNVLMNTTSKVLVGLAVVVVAGIGIYLFISSRPDTNTGDTGTTQSAQEASQVVETKGTTGSPQSTGGGQTVETSASSASPVSQGAAAVLIADIAASLQSDLNAQSAGISTLDQSANQNVSSVDTSNSSKQPYDENSI
jgi:hypothetical protein